MIKKKIKYKTNYLECLTLCPDRNKIKVGSVSCFECDFFVKKNIKKKYVLCSNPECFKYKYPKILIDFLNGKKTPQGKNALKRFVKYVENDKKFPLQDKQKYIKDIKVIERTFSWYKTKEGSQFWKDINTEYQKYFKANQKPRIMTRAGVPSIFIKELGMNDKCRICLNFTDECDYSKGCDIWKEFNTWSSQGHKILKGAKATKINGINKFHISQVSRARVFFPKRNNFSKAYSNIEWGDPLMDAWICPLNS